MNLIADFNTVAGVVWSSRRSHAVRTARSAVHQAEAAIVHGIFERFIRIGLALSLGGGQHQRTC